MPQNVGLNCGAMQPQQHTYVTLPAHGRHQIVNMRESRGPQGLEDHFECRPNVLAADNRSVTPGQGPLHMFSVYDGHTTDAVSKHCAAKLHLHLRKYLQQHGPVHGGYESIMEAALRGAFLTTDQELKEQGVSAASGSTATVVIVSPTNIWIAFCGDSRAVMTQASGDLATIDHRASRDDEQERVEAAGGVLLNNGGELRVMGMLACTRSIGDHDLQPYGVIAEPEVLQIPRSDQDQFLILASDGLWDKFSIQEAVQYSRALYKREQDLPPNPDAKTCLPCRAAYKAAYAMASKARKVRCSRDDITVLVINFQEPCRCTRPMGAHNHSTSSIDPSLDTTLAVPRPRTSTAGSPGSATAADGAGRCDGSHGAPGTSRVPARSAVGEVHGEQGTSSVPARSVAGEVHGEDGASSASAMARVGSVPINIPAPSAHSHGMHRDSGTAAAAADANADAAAAEEQLDVTASADQAGSALSYVTGEAARRKKRSGGKTPQSPPVVSGDSHQPQHQQQPQQQQQERPQQQPQQQGMQRVYSFGLTSRSAQRSSSSAHQPAAPAGTQGTGTQSAVAGSSGGSSSGGGPSSSSLYPAAESALTAAAGGGDSNILLAGGHVLDSNLPVGGAPGSTNSYSSSRSSSTGTTCVAGCLPPGMARKPHHLQAVLAVLEVAAAVALQERVETSVAGHNTTRRVGSSPFEFPQAAATSNAV